MLSSHADYCAGLTGFRRYLLPEQLPFVQPAPGSPAEPQAMLARLEMLAGHRGVVLKGLGGIGKTRTCLEVGHLAARQGWRVLHALPGEPGVTLEALSAALLSEDGPTLLICDDLDQLPMLDLVDLRLQLLPEAKRRGLRLALLATLRPAALRRPNRDRDTLFSEQMLLQPSAEQQASIAELAQERIAPQAIAQLGRERVSELCGERPIIAMFIAAELERRAQQGTLAAARLVGFRGGDMLGWLRERLLEDQKIVVGTGLLPSVPEPWLIAAAAMLTAAPLPRGQMQALGRTATQATGGDGGDVEVLLRTAPRSAKRDSNLEALGRTAVHATGGSGDDVAGPVIEALLALGWLEPRAGELAAAHEVVADEILSQVIWDRGRRNQHTPALSAVLAPILISARLLSRYATALTRLLGAEALETEAEALLRHNAGNWLRNYAARLGQLLAAAELSESAYALCSIVHAPIWANIWVREWSELVKPWMQRHPLDPDREFVLKRLFLLPAPVKGMHAKYVEMALFHLDSLGTRPEAIYLLKEYLADQALDPESAGRIVQLGLGWLRANAQAQSADYIFNRLLIRADVSDDDWQETSEITLAWLRHHQQSRQRDLSLAALLARPQLLKADDLEWLRQAAEQWLIEHAEDRHQPRKLRAALARLNRQEGEAGSSRIDPKTFKRLKAAVLDQKEAPSTQELGEIIDTLAVALDEGLQPGSASFLLPSLLVLVQRSGDPEVWQRLITLARQILTHPDFLARNRDGMIREVESLIKRDAWPETLASPVLEQLDLPRVSSH